MDLSGLKWPLIIVVVIAIGWLGTSGGVNWMISRATAAQPGVDEAQDVRDEAMLSKLGGYQLMLWKWEGAKNTYEMALNRYGDTGKNYWYNNYQLSRCYDRLHQYQISVDILRMLQGANAHEVDERVPNNDNLGLQINKLIEMYDEVN